jgi:hypothetical protein
MTAAPSRPHDPPKDQRPAALVAGTRRPALGLDRPGSAGVQLRGPAGRRRGMLEQDHPPEDRVIRLVGTLLGSFIRTDRSRGYLVSLSEEERQRALSRLTPRGPRPRHRPRLQCAATGSQVAGLPIRVAASTRCRPPAWRLRRETGVMRRHRAADREASGEVHNRLQWAATYIDDEHWAQRQQRDLGFQHVRLTHLHVSQRFGVTLEVSGDASQRRRPRITRQAGARLPQDGRRDRQAWRPDPPNLDSREVG